ncbi:hypothetical protein DN069_37875 [Streptacidiphilus pinicola]|uniref:STAS domain-containing protein n=1 Tax=Streptacidiphilus pinicola TaxID=2219663 RepID=A0A2X0ISG4_9ACTN|nr:hypothetical protein DN069_37875 [Streptacidiphilus pinicola]
MGGVPRCARAERPWRVSCPRAARWTWPPRRTCARLLEAVRRHPAGIVVELSGVTFADCRAVGALVAARNLAAELGRPRPVLRGTPPPVARLLKATGTHHLFTHHA